MHGTHNIKMGFCVVFAILGRREDAGHDKGSHHPPAYKKYLWERNNTEMISLIECLAGCRRTEHQ
jgi:hypothetical protein